MQKEIEWLLKEKYNNKPNKKFYKDVERLSAGEPVDYVIGFTEFLGCKIDLSKKPLIPRPETEYWAGFEINNILTFLRISESFKNRKIKFLDIFSGSGCIGVAILKNIKDSKCVFADKDEKALEQIKINLKLNNIQADRYKIIKSDVFSNVNRKYDYIFANPPYIAKSKINKIQKSVLKFEPKTALLGGKDGLFYIKKFLRDAKDHLNKTGEILMEFDCTQKKEIERLLGLYGYENWQFFRDQYNRWRWVKIY